MTKIRLFVQLSRRIEISDGLGGYVKSIQPVYSPDGLDLSKETNTPIKELALSERAREFLENHKLSEGPLKEIMEEIAQAGYALAVEVKIIQHKMSEELKKNFK